MWEEKSMDWRVGLSPSAHPYPPPHAPNSHVGWNVYQITKSSHEGRDPPCKHYGDLYYGDLQSPSPHVGADNSLQLGSGKPLKTNDEGAREKVRLQGHHLPA